MSGTALAAPRTGELLGVLSRDFAIRLLNCSSSGCLLESPSAIEVGVIASLRIAWGGSEFVEDLKVVRCQPIEGGSMFHVGAEFLWAGVPDGRSLRRAMRRFANVFPSAR